MIDKKSPIILTGLLHIQFIAYKQPHPVHLVVLNETSCLSMFYMIVKISRWVYSPISAIVVGFGLH